MTSDLSHPTTPTAPQAAEPVPDWASVLPEAAWRVLFREATEPPHSSPLNAEKRPGVFVCAACHQPLFASTHKYESGTGWPSFFSALPGTIGTREDRRFFMRRTEYHCARCGGHQGHVFDDGPAPTGLRYCNNGLALHFVAEGEPLPAPRQLAT
jgi:peptide-methionine (R)-S-oxide reductase